MEGWLGSRFHSSGMSGEFLVDGPGKRVFPIVLGYGGMWDGIEFCPGSGLILFYSPAETYLRLVGRMVSLLFLVESRKP